MTMVADNEMRPHRPVTPDEGFDHFVALLNDSTDINALGFAAAVEKNIPVYSGPDIQKILNRPAARYELQREWGEILLDGAGIIAVRQGIADTKVTDRATQIFTRIIEQEKTACTGRSDHFATPGANDRIWNALEKHCLADPENFLSYYASPSIALIAEAWLGPGYQLTAQVNRVNPGGAAQKPHRDYHLGFMSGEQAHAYPAHIHRLSPCLTLQGAVAHCDMPVDSGPTQLLPFSQRFGPGYLKFGSDEYQRYFAEHYVQLELEKGDMLFFNPAVMHAAGENRSSDIYRMANLLQISSAFGRAMEAVNRDKMVTALYPFLLSAQQTQSLSSAELDYAIAASAEGYAFPTNLDTDPPCGGLAPQSQAHTVREALDAQLTVEAFHQRLQAQITRRKG